MNLNYENNNNKIIVYSVKGLDNLVKDIMKGIDRQTNLYKVVVLLIKLTNQDISIYYIFKINLHTYILFIYIMKYIILFFNSN